MTGAEETGAEEAGTEETGAGETGAEETGAGETGAEASDNRSYVRNINVGFFKTYFHIIVS